MTKALSEIFLYPKKGENLRISYEKWEGDDGRRKQSRFEQQRWRRLRRDLWLRRLTFVSSLAPQLGAGHHTGKSARRPCAMRFRDDQAVWRV